MGRVSSEDIARAAQVSRSTVSYVLNDKPGRRISVGTRERVLRVARSLGYVPNPAAVALRSGHSKIVLLQETFRIPAHGYDVLATGSTSGLLRDAVAREVRSWGMVLVTCSADFPLVEALTHLTPGLVLAPGGLSAEDRAIVEQASIPWFGQMPDGRALLDTLNDSLAQRQVQHLRDRGHIRIGYVSTSLDEVADLALKREKAVIRACAELDIQCDEIMRLGLPGGGSLVECESTLTRWRGQGITAAACFNDICAAVALKAARALNWQVPQSFAVIGVDDEPLSDLLDPPLTTVRLQMAELGAHLAACGRAILDDQPLPSLPTGFTPLMSRSTT